MKIKQLNKIIPVLLDYVEKIIPVLLDGVTGTAKCFSCFIPTLSLNKAIK